MRRSVTFIAVTVIVISCGSDGPGATTTSIQPAETTTTSGGIPSTTAPSVTTTSSSVATTTTVLEVDVEIAGGEVTGPHAFEVPLGETFDIWIRSDVDDEIHVHGYDLRFDLVAGDFFNLNFEADVPGVFEVETHDLQEPLFEIEVTG